jgi:hypothetical protein
VLDERRILLAREPEYKINALPEDEMLKLLNYMKNDQTKNEITRMRDYAI